MLRKKTVRKITTITNDSVSLSAFKMFIPEGKLRDRVAKIDLFVLCWQLPFLRLTFFLCLNNKIILDRPGSFDRMFKVLSQMPYPLDHGVV